MCIEQNLLLHCPCSLGGRKLSEVEHELELGLRSCGNSAGKLLPSIVPPAGRPVGTLRRGEKPQRQQRHLGQLRFDFSP